MSTYESIHPAALTGEPGNLDLAPSAEAVKIGDSSETSPRRIKLPFLRKVSLPGAAKLDVTSSADASSNPPTILDTASGTSSARNPQAAYLEDKVRTGAWTRN